MVSSAAAACCVTSTATTSGRGTMICRTTVSPNSKIEWIIFRSISAMLPCSCPTSAIERMSCSETNGPSFSPLPGSRTLAIPISRRVGSASARPRSQTTGARASAARSLCRMPNVFAIASTMTK